MFLVSQFGAIFGMLSAHINTHNPCLFTRNQGKLVDPLRPVILRESERIFGTLQFLHM